MPPNFEAENIPDRGLCRVWPHYTLADKDVDTLGMRVRGTPVQTLWRLHLPRVESGKPSERFTPGIDRVFSVSLPFPVQISDAQDL